MPTLETRSLQLLINPDLYREDGIIQCKVQPHHLWRRRDKAEARVRIRAGVSADVCRRQWDNINRRGI